MRFMHDNTEISKNVMMAAVPPSSNAMNGCTFADIVVNLETSSASYSSRSLARHPSLLNVKLGTHVLPLAWNVQLQREQESPNDNSQSKTTANRGTYPVEMSMQPQRS